MSWSGRRVHAVGALLAAGVALGACGIDPEPSASSIDDADVPFGLLEPAPTAPDEVATGGVARPPGEVVYFVRGECLVAVPRAGADDPQVALPALLSGPTAAERAAELRSPVALLVGTPTLELTADPLRVELPEDFVTLPSAEQRLGIAQLVVTLSPLVPANDVVFRLGDSAVAVPLASGESSAAPVGAADYASLLGPACENG